MQVFPTWYDLQIFFYNNKVASQNVKPLIYKDSLVDEGSLVDKQVC